MADAKNRPAKSEDGLTIIYSPDDVPEFDDEDEEVVYWDTHTWSDELYDEAAEQPRDPDLPPPREEGKPPP